MHASRGAQWQRQWHSNTVGVCPPRLLSVYRPAAHPAIQTESGRRLSKCPGLRRITVRAHHVSKLAELRHCVPNCRAASRFKFLSSFFATSPRALRSTRTTLNVFKHSRRPFKCSRRRSFVDTTWRAKNVADNGRHTGHDTPRRST